MLIPLTDKTSPLFDGIWVKVMVEPVWSCIEVMVEEDGHVLFPGVFERVG